MENVVTLTHAVRMLCDNLRDESSGLDHPLVRDRVASRERNRPRANDNRVDFPFATMTGGSLVAEKPPAHRGFPAPARPERPAPDRAEISRRLRKKWRQARCYRSRRPLAHTAVH
jgi:hypothetical protein